MRVESLGLTLGIDVSLLEQCSNVASSSSAFLTTRNASSRQPSLNTIMMKRRSLVLAGAGAGAGGGVGGIWDNLMSGLGGGNANAATTSSSSTSSGSYTSKGPTNEVVKVVNGMKRRRLGGSDISVSELGLGTQRWY